MKRDEKRRKEKKGKEKKKAGKKEKKRQRVINARSNLSRFVSPTMIGLDYGYIMPGCAA